MVSEKIKNSSLRLFHIKKAPEIVVNDDWTPKKWELFVYVGSTDVLM